jgi:hypothetical protein
MIVPITWLLSMASTVQKAIFRAPLEIWLKIYSYLPKMSSRKLALAFGKELPEADTKHGNVWDAIFDDYEWLDFMVNFSKHHCVLLGYDLHLLYNLNTEQALNQKSGEINLVLLCGEYWSSGNERAMSMFLRCLKKPASTTGRGFPHTVTVPHGSHTIRLSVRAVQDAQEPFVYDNPEKLFSLDQSGLHSAYLYYGYDRKQLRILEPQDIVGIGRYASVCDTTYYISKICGVMIQQPQQRPKGLPAGLTILGPHPHPGKFSWQAVLQSCPGLVEKKYKHGNMARATEPQHCIGWQYQTGSQLHSCNRHLWQRRSTGNRK